MTQFCAFDVEGDTGDKGIISVAIWSDIKQTYTTDSDEAINLLRFHADAGYTLVAHNAQYDIPVLFWQKGLKVKCIYISNRFNRGEWYFEGTKRYCQIWDSLNLSGGLSLEKLGSAIGIPKYQTPQSLLSDNVNKYEWKCQKHDAWECIECYALRDAEICWRYMETYKSFLDAFSIKPARTLASAAVNLWRELDKPVPCHLKSKAHADMARSSYVGGRTECFKLGYIEGIYCSDVKSMYPSVMLDTPMPSPEHMMLLTGDNVSQSVISFEGCCEATVSIPQMYVPPLPIHSNNKLYFPVGKLRGVWTHLELRHAVRCGVQIHQIHWALFSTETVQPFTEYINTLMLTRDEYKKIHDPREYTVKILLNSLYGRLGLDPVQEFSEVSLILPGTPMASLNGYDLSIVGNHIYGEKSSTRTAPSKFANVLWASYITAASRCKLHTYMVLQGDNLIYCDTDSIYSLAPVVGMGEGLGQLQDEGYYDYGYILGPKMYRLIRSNGLDKVRVKGIPQRVATTFLAESEASYTIPVKPRDSLRRGIEAGTWIEVKKSWHRDAGKRQPLYPDNLLTEHGYSDTSPIWFGPSSEVGNTGND